MGLKPGYKETEVGVIPEDWEILNLDTAAKVVDSLHQTPSFSEDGYPMVRVTDIKTGDLSLIGALKVSKTVYEDFTRNYKPKRGDIVLSRVGSYGVSSFVETDEPFCLGQNTVVLQPNLPARFLYYALNSRSIRLQIEDGSYGSGYKSLSLKNIRELRIPAPSAEPEQRAIAGALGDVDALLVAVEKLTIKKRDLKQAAMQQLLTGQKRLPGFSGEWAVKRLADVLDFANGKPHEGHIDQMGRYSLITLDSIGIDGKLKAEHRRIGLWDNSLAKDDIAIILSDLAHGDLLGLCDVIPEDNRYVLNQRVGRLRVKPEEKANPQFLRLQINRHQDHFKKRGQGTSQRHIYRRDIDQLEIELPEADEQTAIADVLSDMDAEIAAPEQRLAKTRAIKQGMMQELLTGRTRLI